MILRKRRPTVLTILLLGLAISEAQNSRSYDTSDWIPIAQPCADCSDGQHVVQKKATGRVLNLPEKTQKTFFPEDDYRNTRQAHSDQQYLKETTVTNQFEAPPRQKQPPQYGGDGQQQRQPTTVEISQEQLQQYYLAHGQLHPKQHVPQQPVPRLPPQKQPQQQIHLVPQHVPNPGYVQQQGRPSGPVRQQLILQQPQQQFLLPQPQQFILQPQQLQLQQAQHQQVQVPPKSNGSLNLYNTLGVQTINRELLTKQEPPSDYKQIDITSTTPKDEKQNVQLLYVPLEQLQDKKQAQGSQNNVQSAQPTAQQFQQFQQPILNNYQNPFQHRQEQIKNIEQDFIQQALEAHRLQHQLRQNEPPYTLPLVASTLPPTTLKPITRKRKPHQPPLAVYMGGHRDAQVTDVLNVLKNAKTIDVQDSVGPESPHVFVGPANLDPPDGYAKFELPYLSSLESNRVERKVDQLPFFVAPLNYKTPPGYSKIPLPSPHVGSVVVSQKEEEEQAPQYVQNHNANQYHTRRPPTTPSHQSIYSTPVSSSQNVYTSPEVISQNAYSSLRAASQSAYSTPLSTSQNTYSTPAAVSQHVYENVNPVQQNKEVVEEQTPHHHIRRPTTRTRGRQHHRTRVPELQPTNVPASHSPTEATQQTYERNPTQQTYERTPTQQTYERTPTQQTYERNPTQHPYEINPTPQAYERNPSLTLLDLPNEDISQLQSGKRQQGNAGNVHSNANSIPSGYLQESGPQRNQHSNANLYPDFNGANSVGSTVTPTTQTRLKEQSSAPNFYSDFSDFPNFNSPSRSKGPYTYDENFFGDFDVSSVSSTQTPTSKGHSYQTFDDTYPNFQQPDSKQFQFPADTKHLSHSNIQDVFSIIPPPNLQSNQHANDELESFGLSKTKQQLLPQQPPNYDQSLQSIPPTSPGLNQVEHPTDKYTSGTPNQHETTTKAKQVKTTVKPTQQAPTSTQGQREEEKYTVLEEFAAKQKTSTQPTNTVSGNYQQQYSPNRTEPEDHYHQNYQPQHSQTITQGQDQYIPNYQPHYVQTRPQSVPEQYVQINPVGQSQPSDAAEESRTTALKNEAQHTTKVRNRQRAQTQKPYIKESTSPQVKPQLDNYQQPPHIQLINPVLPGLINDLQDQSVRQLISPLHLAPTSTPSTVHALQNYETAATQTENGNKITSDYHYSIPTTPNVVRQPSINYEYSHPTTSSTTSAPVTSSTYATTNLPVVPLETTTERRQRVRGRGNSRFNLRTTTTSIPRRNVHRTRTQHPSRSRFRQESNVEPTTTYQPVRQNSASYTTTEAPRRPTIRQRYRTRGRTVQSDASSSVSQRISTYSPPESTTSKQVTHEEIIPVQATLPQPNPYQEFEQPIQRPQSNTYIQLQQPGQKPQPNSYIEVEQSAQRPQLITKSKILSPEEEYLINKYNLAYKVADEKSTEILPVNVEISSHSPQNVIQYNQADQPNPKTVNIQLTHPISEVSNRPPSAHVENIQPKYSTTERQVHSTAPARIRTRIRGRSRTTTTTTTPVPVTVKTTTAEIQKQEEEFYGFIRNPNYNVEDAHQYKVVTQVPLREPVYSPSFISSTIHPVPNQEVSAEKIEGVKIYTNSEQSPSTPVQFVGEIRPKYQPPTTGQYVEISPEPTPSTLKYYPTTTQPPTEPPRKRIRGRMRLPQRANRNRDDSSERTSQQANNEVQTNDEEITTRRAPQRIRGRGRSHYKVPERPKQDADDEDVEGGNYPASFKITVDPAYEDDKDSDQLPYSSFYRPKVVPLDPSVQLVNHWKDDAKSYEDVRDESRSDETSAESTTVPGKDAAQNDSEGITELQQRTTTFVPEVATTRKVKGQRRGFWKLVKHAPVDDFETAESQNVGVVSVNAVDSAEKDYSKQTEFEPARIKAGYKDSSTVRSNKFDNEEERHQSHKESEIEPVPMTTEYKEALDTIQTVTSSPARTTQDFFSSIYQMFGLTTTKLNAENITTAKPTDFSTEPLTDTTLQGVTEKEQSATTTSTPLMPDEITEPTTEITEAETQISTELAEENQDDVKVASATPNVDSAYSDFYPWNMGVVKTSTSTEISHETEICYKGVCIKSKDMK